MASPRFCRIIIIRFKTKHWMYLLIAFAQNDTACFFLSLNNVPEDVGGEMFDPSAHYAHVFARACVGVCDICVVVRLLQWLREVQYFSRPLNRTGVRRYRCAAVAGVPPEPDVRGAVPRPPSGWGWAPAETKSLSTLREQRAGCVFFLPDFFSATDRPALCPPSVTWC